MEKSRERAAAPGDVVLVPLHLRPDLTESCASLLNQAWKRSLGARMHSLERSSDDFPICLVLIVAPEGPALGHARLCRVMGLQDSLFVESVVVTAELRGKGYGRKLMDATERYARGKGFRNLYLTTHDKQDFYHHLGYRLAEPVQSMGILNSLLPEGIIQKMTASKMNSTASHHPVSSHAPPCPPLPTSTSPTAPPLPTSTSPTAPPCHPLPTSTSPTAPPCPLLPTSTSPTAPPYPLLPTSTSPTAPPCLLLPTSTYPTVPPPPAPVLCSTPPPHPPPGLCFTSPPAPVLCSTSPPPPPVLCSTSTPPPPGFGSTLSPPPPPVYCSTSPPLSSPVLCSMSPQPPPGLCSMSPPPPPPRLGSMPPPPPPPPLPAPISPPSPADLGRIVSSLQTPYRDFRGDPMFWMKKCI